MAMSSKAKNTARGKPNFSTCASLHIEKDKYIAGMVLSAAGDSIGYRNGLWEMCRSGETIHTELAAMGGLDKLAVKPPEWKVSDDTVMHLATAVALVQHRDAGDKTKLYIELAQEYKKSMNDMDGRLVGLTCQRICSTISPSPSTFPHIPFDPKGGGCGAAMRAMCIGMRFPRPEHLNDLIEVSIEAGRITHHHPTGYLGSLAAALFASYSIQQKPAHEWGKGLIDVLPAAKRYINGCHTGYEADNLSNWNYFEDQWKEYLRTRGIFDGKQVPVFPSKFNVSKRDQFYQYLSFDGVGGNSGHDATIIAYDAILACNGDWKDLCSRAMLHGGDSDTTGAIAGCLYGLMYGFSRVPAANYHDVEYLQKLTETATMVYNIVKEG